MDYGIITSSCRISKIIYIIRYSILVYLATLVIAQDYGVPNGRMIHERGIWRDLKERV
jgi:hypothetical protein